MSDFVSKTKPSVPFVGDTGSGGEAGAVPAPAIGDSNKVLFGDGTFKSVGAASFDENTILTSQDGAVLVNQFGNVLVTG